MGLKEKESLYNYVVKKPYAKLCVKRTSVDEVKIFGVIRRDRKKLGDSVLVTYNIRENSLRINASPYNKWSIGYIDSNNDGLVESLRINFEIYKRNKANEEAFKKADRNLARYKEILGVDEILPKELEKPTPSLEDYLYEI